MHKYVIFFVTILAAIFVYFSYINFVSKAMKNNARPEKTETQRILDEQSAEIKRLNQNYRDIIDQTKRREKEAASQFTSSQDRRTIDQTLDSNRRQLEENRRQMEQMRRDMQRY